MVNSKSTYKRGDSGHTQPDADEGAVRTATIGSNRTNTTRVRVGAAAIRWNSREGHIRKYTDPGLGGMRTASPEDVATRAAGLILRAGVAGAGPRASGSFRHMIPRLISSLTYRVDDFPTDRGTRSRPTIPTALETWNTRGGGQQRVMVNPTGRRAWIWDRGLRRLRPSS